MDTQLPGGPPPVAIPSAPVHLTPPAPSDSLREDPTTRSPATSSTVDSSTAPARSSTPPVLISASPISSRGAFGGMSRSLTKSAVIGVGALAVLLVALVGGLRLLGISGIGDFRKSAAGKCSSSYSYCINRQSGISCSYDQSTCNLCGHERQPVCGVPQETETSNTCFCFENNAPCAPGFTPDGRGSCTSSTGH